MPATTRILHISSYYSRSPIYLQLVNELSKYDSEQHVFAPIRTAKDFGLNRDTSLENVQYTYAHVLKFYHRVLYGIKIRTTYKRLLTEVDLDRITVTHAHSLFSDGALAYKLYQDFDIPYIVAVRNTDLSIFFKYMIHLRPLAIRILRSARSIVFINADYKEALLSKYIASRDDRKLFSDKSHVIPNGINRYWFEKPGLPRKLSEMRKIRLLFVGTFTRRKNVPLTIKGAESFAAQNRELDVELTLLGGGGRVGRGKGDPMVQKVLKQLVSPNLKVSLPGRVTDIELLRAFYQDADILIMPSKTETFGLVYIEAMSQGVPVIYVKGHGISSYFADGEVGHGISIFSESEIVDKINLIIGDYEAISQRCIEAGKKFNWPLIAKQYWELYRPQQNIQ